MFSTSQPVTEAEFFDRRRELSRLGEIVSALESGHPSWLAILGQRKIGKSSLLLEAARKLSTPLLGIAVLDTSESAPLSAEFFRVYALRCLDVLTSNELGASLEAAARTPETYRNALSSAGWLAKLDPSFRGFLLELPTCRLDPASIRECLALPERLATLLGRRLLVAIDEFQDLAALSSKLAIVDPVPVMRASWQRHRRVSYVISGSSRTMIEELVTSKSSPFFQHFAMMEVGPFAPEDATEFLVSKSPLDRRIPAELAKRAIELVGSHPFYVQLMGDALVRANEPFDDELLKAATQDLLFSRSGRLALYFQIEFERVVGRSTYLASALESLAEGDARLSVIAQRIGATTGQTSNYLSRLGDVVVRRPDGSYGLSDSTFGLWLRWRKPGGSVVPMTILGDEAERQVTLHLAGFGFDLVYQSRASRGAFDLLATRGARHLGIQVKRSALPLRFSKAEWARMVADGKRLGWAWIIAAVTADGIHLLDPRRARKGREVRVPVDASIENILAWLDATPANLFQRPAKVL
ncbi:MAG: ATP-binding protein [Deltaproteobacteria bacterium]|nr:ATP-binding protein [Deltaproteobacteria bacterium]